MIYIVKFSARKVGALGISETEVREVEASSPQEAEEKGRALLYAEGFEHVHSAGIMIPDHRQ